MGFQNENSGSVTWAKIANGKVILTSKAEMQGYVSRTNKVGNVVWELFYDSFSGKLTNVRSEEGMYGTQWFFEFDDEGSTIIVTTGYDNRYARTLINRLLNKAIDYNNPITLKPYSFITDDERKMSGVNVFQFGKKLNPRFLPEELPKAQEVKVKKQITYNYSEQMDFLEEKIQQELLPRLTGNKTPKVTTDKDGFLNIEDDIDVYDGLQD